MDIHPFCAGARAGERKESMKILLTVGHSILKSGVCTSADGRPYGGVLEYAYNKGIVNQAATYLRKAGHTVDVLVCPELQFSRSTDEKSYKVPKANAGGYDLVAELHLNASALHNASGCEVLYISDAGKIVAQRIQDKLATVFKDRGIAYRDNLYMLTKTEPVAVMVESFFCDSSADCELAEKTDVALLIAEGIHGGDIAAVPEEERPTGMLYRVQSGAFAVRANADRLLAELKGKGYDAFITTVDLAGQILYRVQVGAYSVRSNAETMCDRLTVDGYDAIIVQA